MMLMHNILYEDKQNLDVFFKARAESFEKIPEFQGKGGEVE